MISTLLITATLVVASSAYAWSGSFAGHRASSISQRCIDRKVAMLQTLKMSSVVQEDTVVVEYSNKKLRKGSSPEFVIDGDSVEETPIQKALVYMHFGLLITNLILAAVSISALSGHIAIPFTILAVLASIVLGDLGTGVFHWAVDNYGSINTPIFGSVCAAFQGHHQSPWTITYRSFVNNVYKIAIATVPVMGLLTILEINPFIRIFFALFINWWLMSQELHKYSHMKQPPGLVKLLQNSNLILSRKEHGLHHSSPFEGHYCIVTGTCNKMLDDSNFFRELEKIVYKLTGNEPMTWKHDPTLKQQALLD